MTVSLVLASLPLSSSWTLENGDLWQTHESKRSRAYECRYCGELGHNIATCDLRGANEALRSRARHV